MSHKRIELDEEELRKLDAIKIPLTNDIDKPLFQDQEEKFCQEYLIDINPTEAAIRAGYDFDTAEEKGRLLIQSTRVINRIEYLIEERKNILGLEDHFIVNGFLNIFKTAMVQKPVIIKGKQKTMTTDKNKVVGVFECDLANANRALENIGKIRGMFIQKIDVRTKTQTVNFNVPASPFTGGNLKPKDQESLDEFKRTTVTLRKNAANEVE